MTEGPQPTRPGVDEFAHIPNPRRRHPVVAGGAAVLAFVLVAHLSTELRYTLSSSEPLDLGEARVTFSPRTTVSGLDNRYVRVRGAPDRESALEVDTKGSWTSSQFFRVLGTGDRLFLHRRENPLPGAKAEADVFEGRLVRFGELTFEDAVRAYHSAHVAASHFFRPEDLRAAIAGAGALELKDLAGDPAKLAPDDLLFVDILHPDEVRIGLPRARFADGAAARAELERRGAAIVTAKGLVKVDAPGAAASAALAFATPTPPIERWTFVVRFPAEVREAALNALGELDPKVEIRDARETLKVKVADVTATDDGLSMRPGGGTERRVPLVALASVRTVATAKIPADAYLLIEADRPRDHLSTLLLALAVATFGVFNLAALARELRPREPSAR